jgi:hypothetical protein
VSLGPNSSSLDHRDAAKTLLEQKNGSSRSARFQTALELTAVPLVAVTGAAVYYTPETARSAEIKDVKGKASAATPASPEGTVTFPAPEGGTIDQPVKLPSGEYYGNGRGYGWDIVKRTPGLLDRDDVGQIIEAPNAVREVGPYDVVIGDNPNGKGEIVLWLLEGVVIQAEPYERLNDPTERTVIIDRSDEHPIRGGDHANSWDEIRRAVENPDEIFEKSASSPHPTSADRWYIVSIGGSYLVVRTHCKVVPVFGTYACTVSTSIYYDTIQEVRQSLRERGFNLADDRVYP